MPRSPASNVDEIMKALAHPARREILAWLKAPEKVFVHQCHPFSMGVCARTIFDKSALSPSTVSAHLAILRKAKLVTTTKVGQWIFYARNEPVIAQFLARMRSDL
jgi:ArsR family transcriptional regulator